MANTRLFVCLPAERVTYPGVLCLCLEQTEFSRGRISTQLKTLVLAAHFSRDNNANIFTAALHTLSECKRAAHSPLQAVSLAEVWTEGWRIAGAKAL